MSIPWLRPFLLSVSIGLVAAQLCVLLHTPLPWMIGPLFASAAARVAGFDVQCPAPAREAGQWCIGTALGLYFTHAVLAVVGSYIGYIVVAVGFALALGMACGWVLHRVARIDKTTAFFAMAVGGASEMAVQGDRHGASVDKVAAAHSLRIMMVVAMIPFGFKFWDVHGADVFIPGARVVDPGGLLLLVLLTSTAAMLMKRLNLPNGWVLGPLLMTIALTGFDCNLSALPQWMINGGQVLIGVSLGTRFTREFLHTAPRYLAWVVVCTVLAMLLALGFGLLLAWVSGIHPATAVLATSPGGIAEMSLTARNLQLGVPIVTAFHVTRMAALVLLVGPMFRLAKRMRG